MYMPVYLFVESYFEAGEYLDRSFSRRTDPNGTSLSPTLTTEDKCDRLLKVSIESLTGMQI